MTDFLQRHLPLLDPSYTPPSSDRALTRIHNDRNKLLPFREKAPDRIRWRSDPESPYSPAILRTTLGLYGVLLHRAATFNAPVALANNQHPLIIIPEDWKALMATRQSSYLVNRGAYGSANKYRNVDLIPILWQEAKDKTSEWVTLLSNTNISFSDVFRFFLNTTRDDGHPRVKPISKFTNAGMLTIWLICGDLSYAQAIPAPTVREVGKYIHLLNKGALSGLKLLGLLPQTFDARSEGAQKLCEDVFEALFKRLQTSLSASEQSSMLFDAVMLEHALCKLSRHVRLKYFVM
ncbi:hypothetical protein HGRIS_001166 [Hohenbuehelia grisea]